MKIPNKVKSGEVARAEDFNALIDVVRQLAGKLGVVEDVWGEDTASPHAFWADIEAATDEGGEVVAGKWRVVFTRAWLRDLPSGDLLPVFEEAEEGGDDPAEFEVSDGDKFYLRVQTTIDGQPTQIELKQYGVGSDEPEETLHQPQWLDSSEEGDYFIKICDFRLEDGSLVARYYYSENVLWQQWGGAHVGTGARIVKAFNEEPGKLEVCTIDGVESEETPGVDIEITEGDTIIVEATPKGASGTASWVGECDSNRFSAMSIVVENGMVKQMFNGTIKVGECCTCDDSTTVIPPT